MNLEKGLAIEALEMATLTQEMLKEYAQASGDYNKIHLDEDVAKGVGLPGIIAHGMLVASLVSERARRFRKEFLGVEWWACQMQVRFRNMSFPGEKILVGGKVRELSENTIVIELAARNEDGELKTTSVVSYKKRS